MIDYVHNADIFIPVSISADRGIIFYSKNETEYNRQYAKGKLKCIPLDIQKEKYEEVKSSAAAGETVNGNIKKAIAMRMVSELE